MFILLFLLLPSLQYAEGSMEEITAGPGDEIMLSCPVNTEVCGAYHSLKWYHEDTRVYVFSPSAQFKNAEGALMNRCLDPTQQSLGPACVRGSLEVTDTSADLRISPLELTDEGEYRCEITYLDISNNCPVVHFTEVVTMAAPESVTITDHEDGDITGQVVGPYAAGEEVAFSCQARGGKPAPAMTWMLGDEVLEGDISEEEDVETGSWKVRSELVVMLVREHTGADLACIVEHEALDDALGAHIQVDVNVPVSSVSIAEEEVSGQEGVEMTLTCTAEGGRPAPTFSWNMPENIQFQQEDSSSLLDDETFESVSKLTFTPSHEENGKEASCQAINDVMDEALEDLANLFVEYAPQVNIEEGNETAAAGEKLLINCEIKANPEELFNIQWFHNDNALDISDDRFHWENTGTPFLSITPIQPSDAGVYSCSAENSVGQTRSPLTYNLEVTSPVQSVSIQEDLTGTAGDEMTIVCVATGARPAAELEIMDTTENGYFDIEQETHLLEDNTYETTIRLILTLHKGLDGISCEAVNEIMEEAIVATAELNILYPPIVTIEEENITASTGDELIIECDIVANPENLTLVQWYQNGDALDLNDMRVQGDAPAIYFTPVQASDAGKYYCYAENEVGKGQSHTVMLNVISVVESVIIEDESGIEAKEMVLTCVALGGHPASTITWVMPDNVLFSVEEEVSLLEEETFQTVSKLTFTPSAEENEKTVSCQAINDVMEEAVDYETELNILYKPIVIIEDENLTVTAGDEVTLDCLIEANPINLTLVEWFHNEELVDANDARFEDGNSENPSLTINPVLAEDAGDYYCQAQNQLGQSRSNSSVSLLVIYPPTVEIRREPTGILKEEDDMNVTLHCELVDGNPLELTRVYWFMNDELIRQLPDPHCEQLESEDSETLFDEQFISEAGDYELGSGIDGSSMVDIGSGMEMGSGFNPDSDVGVNYLCDVDPTELFLQHVTRDFSGNFSCSGTNIAGDGPPSEAVYLDVFYIPGQSLITQEEDAQKGGSITLICNVEDQGNPVAVEYLWRRGEESLDETSANLTLDNLSADSQGSFSCAAVNELGQGLSDNLDFVVLAPPSFMQSLPEEATLVSDDPDLNLKCQVECSPLCSIKWMKNEVLIAIEDDKYNIEEELVPNDIENNQFQSLISKLSWNLENLADNKLDHNELNFTISCFVEETEAGDGISSSSQIEVEYAPENIEISTTFISLEENEVIDPTFCYGEGVPEPTVVWKFQDREITSENTLDFLEPMTREQGGVYSCHIENEHGKEVVNVTVDVLYKPECSIDYRLEEEEVVLICKAEANPEEVKFWWEKNNITFDGQSAENTLENEVRLKIMNESTGVYLCHINNTIGQGEPCMIDLTMDMMMYGLSEEVTVILIAVAGSFIVLLIIIIIIACLYCGEKKDNKGAAPMKKNKSKSPLLKDDKDDKVHADSSFYENLPFKGLKSPPKQVVDDRNSDMMDYADADYLDIYANGPLKYRETSEKNATLRRQKIEQRKSDLL